MPGFNEFFEALVLRGLENFRLYYGVYRGVVTRNDDPDKRGRVQAYVPQVLQTQAPNVWIDPAFDGAGSERGWFCPPEVGDNVRVSFEHGNPAKPIIYFGGWFGGASTPNEFSYTEGKRVTGQTGTVAVPERRGFITRKGHRLVFSDVDGKEQIELVWHRRAPTDPSVTAESQGDRSKSADRDTGDTASLVFDANGDIILTNKNGSKITLGSAARNIVIEDENHNVATMDSSGVRVKTKKMVIESDQTELSDDSDVSGIRGEDLLQWLKTLTVSTAWGPSGTPIVPPPRTMLSKHVKLR